MTSKAEVLIDALDYIEEHIAGDIAISEVAEYCCVSVSSLQKTFKYAFHFSVNEYMLRRRFSCAARDLLATEDSILDIALKYGYSTPESFTRGFHKIWGIVPSEYRKTRHFTGHTPRLAIPSNLTANYKEDYGMSGIRYELTDLYDVLQERKNNAYVCADLVRLMWINDTFGKDAGDAALLELMRRVEEACSEDDIFLRVGGDEFVVLTASEDMSHANDIVNRVSAQNGQPITLADGRPLEVSIHIGAFQEFHEHHVKADEVFSSVVTHIYGMK